ncbi:hypothetical protein GUITHDRAFT_117154 [Guillardia theta CCMP2712]|uniref:Uncharacterized protein n=1 Tax=Guillardia theta (strain CCMP2712) TaxID=905079 RepID=L1IKE9_GUITC|nr:hypothetical protein GUITHDRAFT_117154 [Guillardia theta CCMP2712]EKX36723.1 hypothetical protein GUITHDRAFT_117154 [Guillardia theta CCMP2712]|eukprot:XP_005823703.1 hypothetical protein GUITHDRAFT_117154 [Guillardia theta CCMP2712]
MSKDSEVIVIVDSDDENICNEDHSNDSYDSGLSVPLIVFDPKEVLNDDIPLSSMRGKHGNGSKKFEINDTRLKYEGTAVVSITSLLSSSFLDINVDAELVQNGRIKDVVRMQTLRIPSDNVVRCKDRVLDFVLDVHDSLLTSSGICLVDRNRKRKLVSSDLILTPDDQLKKLQIVVDGTCEGGDYWFNPRAMSFVCSDQLKRLLDWIVESYSLVFKSIDNRKEIRYFKRGYDIDTAQFKLGERFFNRATTALALNRNPTTCSSPTLDAVLKRPKLLRKDALSMPTDDPELGGFYSMTAARQWGRSGRETGMTGIQHFEPLASIQQHVHETQLEQIRRKLLQEEDSVKRLQLQVQNAKIEAMQSAKETQQLRKALEQSQRDIEAVEKSLLSERAKSQQEIAKWKDKFMQTRGEFRDFRVNAAMENEKLVKYQVECEQTSRLERERSTILNNALIHLRLELQRFLMYDKACHYCLKASL